MKETIHELKEIISVYSEKLSRMPDDTLSHKPLPHKWSKREVIGHLIDSAHNNLRRFIVGQYDENAVIVYDQDFWVKANAYQEMDKSKLIDLWKSMNERICNVLAEMPAANYTRQLNTGKDFVQLHSLQWLASDYVKHMKHHLNQVFENAFDVVYP